MAKNFQTEVSIEKAIQAGRGKGQGKDYSPWLEIHQVPSLGKSSRIKGWKTGRIHHLLSQLELHYMYLCEWNDNITDIREQYPLLPREDIQTICKELGIPHPKDPRTGINIVMTTDFVLTDTDGRLHAKTIKPSKDLESERVVQKLEIERVFWEQQGATWKILTEQELSVEKAKSIEWLHSKRLVEDMAPITPKEIHRARIWLETRIANGFQVKLSDICSRCDEELGFLSGSSLSIARHLLANKVWHTPIAPRITPHKPLTITLHGDTNKQSVRVG